MHLQPIILAICVIGFLEFTALCMGVNGTAYVLTTNAIAVLGGLGVKRRYERHKEEKAENATGPETIFDMLYD